MTDFSSGWFALGGALIGTTGTQVAAIINNTSKSRARKRKDQREDKAARAAQRRALYEQLIGYLDKAEQYTALVLVDVRDAGPPSSYTEGFGEYLEPVRATSVSIQIDGSERAQGIVTELLRVTHDLWLQATLVDEVAEDQVERTHDGLVLARAAMVEVAQADFGG